MLEELISISTLMLCTLLATAVIGIFMLQVWITDRRHAAAGYWCLSMWTGTVAALLLALRPFDLPPVTIGIGNGLAALAYGFMWAGFRVFDLLPVHRPALLAGVTGWAVAYLFVPQVTGDVNNRIVVMSVIIAGYALAIGIDVWRQHRIEPLPTRKIAAIVFLSHGLIYSMRIPMALLMPASVAHGTAYSAWFALFTLELFAHTILSAIAMLVLIKERGEALYRQASRTDGLTGIANRSSFFDDVHARLDGKTGQGTLMVFDLDRFKAVNDTYGHLAGDAVLRRFADRVSAWLEPGMLFGRFGGEEFALFAPHHDIERAGEFAEILRREVSMLSISVDGQEFGVTVSIGLADVAAFGADFGRLHAAADGALYAAKAGGRNRVMHAERPNLLAGMADRMRGTDSRLPVSSAGAA